MAPRTPKDPGSPKKQPTRASSPDARAETHQTATGRDDVLTTNQGVPVSDNQNSLRTGDRGPTLLEDFVLREKLTHFDHERIPERVVHARGSGAHGYFEPYRSWSDLSRAAFLQDPAKRTPVFARFSTVAGGAGSGDLHRDVRGFAVKFYTEEGNFDLVGNNMPVFFIQDAMKFPDLVHAVKMEPDRGFPVAASAHDTFWDFVSLMPESMHMLMWLMSDRAIPRSLRMMEGFGVHTFRLVDNNGGSTFVKFHWRPMLGAASVVWDEAVKINGADPEFHRRDLWESIERADFPEFELCIQSFAEESLPGFPFDVLDPTKLIPEELVPLTPIGRMVLDRNPTNFFAETEQVAFHTGHVVPGIDFSNDPLLQGRLFSYLDTQLKRLGGPNFHEIPINRPQCPMRNLQRDGHMRQSNPAGRVAYEPNSLDPAGPRESPERGFTTSPAPEAGPKTRHRSETFSDHYSQARMFWQSMSAPEQRHIVSAFAFELGKVETVAIRSRMLGHLDVIHPDVGAGVAEALGMVGEAEPIVPHRAVVELSPSAALSMVKKAVPTLVGRKVGVLVTDGTDADLLESLRSAVAGAGGRLAVVAPRVGGVVAADGRRIVPDHALSSTPSVFFDAVVLLPSAEGATRLLGHAAAIDWIRDAYGHLKVIGRGADAQPLLARAGVEPDEGVLPVTIPADLAVFVQAAEGQRIWAREPLVRPPG